MEVINRQKYEQAGFAENDRYQFRFNCQAGQRRECKYRSAPAYM